MSVSYRKCPACESRKVIPIVYGEPDYTLQTEAHEGKVLLGGCVLMPDSPDYYCQACGNKWTKVDALFHTYQEIDGLEVHIGGVFGEQITVRIDFNSQKLVWNQTENNLEIELTEHDVKQIRGRLLLTGILDWRRKYERVGVTDGTHWQVTLFRKPRILKRSGINAYPREWSDFCALISEYAGRKFG